MSDLDYDPIFGVPHRSPPTIDERWEAAIRDLGGMIRAMGDNAELIVRKSGEHGVLFTVTAREVQP